MRIWLDIPCVTTMLDYHEIPTFNDRLKVLNKKLRCVEINVESLGYRFPGRYTGLIYLAGKKPTKAEIKNLLESSGFKKEPSNVA